MSLALCLRAVSPAPQHFRSYETQATCDGCFSRQSMCSVTSFHSSMSRTVHLRRWTSAIDACQSGLQIPLSSFCNKPLTSPFLKQNLWGCVACAVWGCSLDEFVALYRHLSPGRNVFLLTGRWNQTNQHKMKGFCLFVNVQWTAYFNWIIETRFASIVHKCHT